jgi:hypothetical protein
MKADYDSEADAILIELEEVGRWDSEVGVDEGGLCAVALRDDRPVAVTLRYPRERSGLLGEAAKRFDLDELGLTATLQAALAAPDHLVTVAVNPRELAGSEAKAA